MSSGRSPSTCSHGHGAKCNCAKWQERAREQELEAASWRAKARDKGSVARRLAAENKIMKEALQRIDEENEYMSGGMARAALQALRDLTDEEEHWAEE